MSEKVGLENIRVPEVVVDASGKNGIEEKKKYGIKEKRNYSVEDAINKATLKGLEQDIEERKKYASRIFCLICVWLFGLFVFLFFQGFGSAFGWFRIAENVSITLISGTTVNVLGIFIIVVRYLFNASGGSERKPLVKIPHDL